MCISLETWRKIDTLAKICNCSKSGILNKIIEPLFEVGTLYDKADLETFPLVTRSNVIYQFYGQSNKFNFSKNQPVEVGHDD